MLDLETVDLADLALALEDHSSDHSWWLDLGTGSVEPRFGSPATDGNGGGVVAIEALPSEVGYADMADFVARVRDPRARHMLERALNGRGAFRRFKDTLVDYPKLRRAWFSFHDARGERRAIEWLLEHRLVEPDAAEAALAARPEPGPEDLPGVLDAHGIVHRIARELRRLYGPRLSDVVLVGGWARGDAPPESAIELMVVLADVPDPWQEKRRMDRIVWRYSARHDTVVTVLPVSVADLDDGATPLITRAGAEGISIG
jgi:Uncharacterised protein family (UPF0158)